MSIEAKKFLEKLNKGPLSLGQLINSIRLGEECSQVNFADILGISKSHLCDIEKGRKTVSPQKAAEYATTLGYSPEQFIRLAIQDDLAKAGLSYKVDIRAS